MPYRFGDVVLLDYPFTDASGSKRRPGLVLLTEEDGDILFARITSKERAGEFDVSLREWEHVGLAYPSIVRLSKMVSLHRNLALREIGQLSETDKEAVLQLLQYLVQSMRNY